MFPFDALLPLATRFFSVDDGDGDDDDDHGDWLTYVTHALGFRMCITTHFVLAHFNVHR